MSFGPASKRAEEPSKLNKTDFKIHYYAGN